ncbi:hypothetical protein BH10ACI2_BH10ACI2_16740 [soil metagenome]
MLNADVLTFQEFVMHEPLPLSKIQEAVLEFMQGRDDAVLFGAQAVNAYVSEPRATQDVDILSTRAKEFAEELREHLSERFHIAVRVREIADKGLRIYQTRKEGNRHLVDIRIEKEFPANQEVERIRVLTPVELIASKIVSFQARFGQAKSWSDRRDLTVLLNRFPDLKVLDGEVEKAIIRRNASVSVKKLWRELVLENFVIEDEDNDLMF